MSSIKTSDVIAAIGPVDGLILGEMLKTGASLLELHRALAFARSPSSGDGRLYDSLSPAMRRLVDLVGVALERLPSPYGPAAMPPEVSDRAA